MSFKAVQAKIAKTEHVPLKNAGAILAKSSRNASAAAKRKNPKLLRVKGGHNPGSRESGSPCTGPSQQSPM